MALEDAQRTVGLVRFHATEWHIDPHKIGVLGFSSGGHLVAAMSTHFAKRLYPTVDAADKESCRPDFAVAMYPGHLSLSAAQWDAKQGTRKFVIHYPATADKSLGLNPDISVTHQTPPTFLLQAEDDHADNVNDSLAYYIALKNAGVPVEMHLYAEGGHAFGLRRTKLKAARLWPKAKREQRIAKKSGPLLRAASVLKSGGLERPKLYLLYYWAVASETGCDSLEMRSLMRVSCFCRSWSAVAFCSAVSTVL